MHFGFRAQDESRELCWGDLQLLRYPQTQREMLVWKAERGTKTRHVKVDTSASFLQSFLLHKLSGALWSSTRVFRLTDQNPDSPFFLAVNHQRKSDDNVWYKTTAFGKNLIGKFLTTAAKEAGLGKEGDKKIANHSVRKTSISELLDADIPENYVMQLSGHKNIQSLSSYKSASLSHPRLMSDTLSNSRNSMDSSTSPHESTSCARSASASVEIQLETRPATSTQALTTTTEATISSHNQAVFAGARIGSISNCTIQIMPGPVKIIHETVVKRRHIAIDSDEEDDWFGRNLLAPSRFSTAILPEFRYLDTDISVLRSLDLSPSTISINRLFVASQGRQFQDIFGQ